MKSAIKTFALIIIAILAATNLNAQEYNAQSTLFTFDMRLWELTTEASPPEGGSVSEGGNYLEWKPVPVEANPAVFYVFVNWTHGSDIICNDAEFEFVMPGEHVVLSAIFIQDDSEIITVVYTEGDIPTDRTLPSSCPGILNVNIPDGFMISGIDVSYTMTTANNGWMSEQRSRLYSPTTGTGEESYVAGSGNSPGTQSYERTGLTFANGATGEIEFHMDAGRTWGGSGCNTTYNKVDNNSWVLIIYYIPIDIVENLNIESETISTGNTECFDALHTITVSDFTVESGGSATLIAGESIHLLPGTTVEHGGYLLARIAQHEDDYCGMPKAIEIAKEPVASKEEEIVLADFNYEIRENGFFKLYPNPTDGTFTLELTTAELEQTITVEVHSMLGGRLFIKELPPQRLHSLSLEGQQPGMYIIRVMKGGKVGVERLIKR